MLDRGKEGGKDGRRNEERKRGEGKQREGNDAEEARLRIKGR
jgi:hypothetical protein